MVTKANFRGVIAHLPILWLLLLSSLPLFAQTAGASLPYGYAVAPAAPGREGAVHFAGGFDIPVYKGLGAGGELGYLTRAKDFSDGIGVLSANGSYSFNNLSSRKVVPFFTGGYSLFFRSGTANGFNVGGGINYWMRDTLGLRLEFRNQVIERESYYTFRMGIALRGKEINGGRQ